jgi:tetratricopeptide (TPR) repeat protein
MTTKLFIIGVCISFSHLLNAQNNNVVIDSLFHKAFRTYTYAPERQKILDSIIQIDPKNAYAWQQKAMPLFKMKKYEIALPYLDSAVKYDKDFHWHPYRAFMKCIFMKAYRASLEDFNAIDKKYWNYRVMDHSFDFYRALCYLQLNQLDSALVYSTISIERDEKTFKKAHYLEYFYKGIILMEQGKYLNAIETLDLSIGEYPQFSDAWYYKSLIYRFLKEKESSEVCFKNAKEFFQKGYTINEDNVYYELYPYQINRYIYDY